MYILRVRLWRGKTFTLSGFTTNRQAYAVLEVLMQADNVRWVDINVLDDQSSKTWAKKGKERWVRVPLSNAQASK